MTIRVRIDGVEARCAEAARDLLDRRIGNADIQATHVACDKYDGRVAASVADAHGDIAAALLRSCFARPCHGGKRQPWYEAA